MCKSREIKALGVVLDTKTANIELFFTIRNMKLISPEEFQLLQNFIEAAISQKQEIAYSFA